LKRLLLTYYIFVRDFFKDLFDERLGFYAASMSWSTLFFIIPLLVILLSLLTYMPIFDNVYIQIHDLLAENLLPTNSKMIMGHIDTFVDNAGKMGLMGIGYVVFAVVMFFRDYDHVVNDIFHAPRRKLLRAVKTYSILILLVPLLIAGSFWIASMLQASPMASMLHLPLLVPFLIVWGLFYITYQLSPKDQIKPSAALISSFISSLIWYLAKSAFLFYALHNHTYTSIYGGLSTLLFFFLWIYISWAVFLHGLRLCYLLDKDEEIEEI
jgi:membrane protein